jgi:long-subunit fatty acid transport protein
MPKIPLILLLFLLIWGAPKIYGQGVASTVGGISATPTKVTPAGVFWNPAVIGFCEGTQLETNFTVLGGWMIYDRAGTDPNTARSYKSSDMSAMAPTPFFAVNSNLGTRDFRFGYATYFPAGVMASFDPSGSQRYNLIDGMVVPWYHQLTLAYRLNSDWSIAIAGIYALGFFKTSLAIDLENLMSKITNSNDMPKENPALQARARIPMTTAHGFGGAIGLYYSPSYQWAFGLSAFAPIHFEFEGPLYVEIPKTVSRLSAGLRALGIEDTIESSGISKATIPPFIQLGISYQPYGYFTTEFFGRYVFSSLDPSVSFEMKSSPVSAIKNYKRTGFALENTYVIGAVNSFALWQRWTLGLNTTYSTNGVKDEVLSTSLADFNSFLVGSFAQYQWSQNFKVGIEYSHSFMFDRTATGTNQMAQTNSIFKTASTDGSYRASSDRFGLMVKYAF